MLAIAPTIIMFDAFLIKLQMTVILVEIFDPPIIQVTGSFLFLTTVSIAAISFFNKGPA